MKFHAYNVRMTTVLSLSTFQIGHDVYNIHGVYSSVIGAFLFAKLFFIQQQIKESEKRANIRSQRNHVDPTDTVGKKKKEKEKKNESK